MDTLLCAMKKIVFKTKTTFNIKITSNGYKILDGNAPKKRDFFLLIGYIK